MFKARLHGSLWLTIGVWIALVSGQLAAAQEPAASGASGSVSLEARLAKVEQLSAEAKSAGDNAWMLVSCALVLMMTGPGLALFYGGLVRRKNVLATMMQSFAHMAVISVLWAIFIYSLCFGTGASFIGGFGHLFLNGVGAAPEPDYAATI